MTSVPSPEEGEMARARLAAVRHDALVAGVDTEEIIRHGKQPVQEVIATAHAAASNILIIGRRQPRGDLKERMVGDIAHHILDQAPCHVLIAGWQSRMWEKRILLASDGSAASDAATEICGQIAKVTGTPVTIVTAIASERDRSEATADAAHKAGLMRLEGVDCDVRVTDGAPEQAIIAAARELGADLVIVGHHRGKGLNRVIAGSVTDRVIGSLACAVLVVKAGPEGADVAAAIAKQS
jgi:nucleotide-binding universal stress UspA family protein